MGRLIDCTDVYNAIQIATDNFGVAKRVVETNMLTMLSKIETVEAIPKADYEARLKADMVDMLTEIKKEIEGQSKIPNNCASAYDWENGVYACYKVIQRKIDALKSESEETE